MNAPARLREAMPITAAWIDELRAAFGAAPINAAIKGGMQGLQFFWASENGQEVGTRDTATENAIAATRMVFQPKAEPKETHADRNRRHR